MERDGPSTRLTDVEARSGATHLGVRYVLSISMALAIVAVGALCLFYAKV